MTNYDRNPSDLDYREPPAPRRSSPGAWIAGIVVVVILVVAAGYAWNSRSGRGMIEHRAAAPDVTTSSPMTPAGKPAAAPVNPAPPAANPAAPATPQASPSP
jgi:hypothetical protein